MHQLVLASHNQGKIAELEKCLTPFGIQLIAAQNLNIPNIEETGTTFSENALLKAENAYKHTGLPSLADDSGLCVTALDDAPGVYTARYGGPEKLLQELDFKENSSRSARFECTLCLVDGTTAPHYFTGTVHGQISHKMLGERGFGYDPIFIPQGDTRTYAAMSAAEKAQTSHRSQALASFTTYLQALHER